MGAGEEDGVSSELPSTIGRTDDDVCAEGSVGRRTGGATGKLIGKRKVCCTTTTKECLSYVVMTVFGCKVGQQEPNQPNQEEEESLWVCMCVLLSTL